MGKDKSVISRLLNGKYTMSLLDYIGICNSLNISPVSILEELLYPNDKRIYLNEAEKATIQEMVELFQKKL